MTAVEDVPAASATAATGVPASEEVARQQAIEWANGQAARLTERVMSNPPPADGRANGGVAPRIGAPTTDLGGPPYVAFDVIATSPITVAGPQLIYPPSKIIPAGSLSFLVAFIYTVFSKGLRVPLPIGYLGW